MNDINKYNYTYSAKNQAEILEIRDKYIPKEADKLTQLRILDASVAKKGTMISLIVGVLSCLILGVGMSCIMVWGENLFLIGVVIGIIGLAGIFSAYPLYVYIVRKERERIAPEILWLSDELLSQKSGIEN